MPLETWLAYTLVTTTFLLIPGPTIILVISYSLLRGRQAVIALVLGVGLGDLTAMSLSFLGVGVLLQTVATAFYLIKWLGAAYLIWLGIKMWSSASEFTDLDKKNRSHAWREIFSSAYITTSLNPKSILFFLAFIPQFIEPELPFTTQVVILGATFFVLAIISVLGYAALAIYAGQQLHLPLIQRWTHRIGGGLLIGAGGMTAVTS
ncbi:MAG: LysE family translocator [Deltaproteobacteria bacterium]|jgi:threonine/homoserine/homoserine lactone efflux protein|nr:LysE family translocator [Deltaproteobacteria bacterium]